MTPVVRVYFSLPKITTQYAWFVYLYGILDTPVLLCDWDQERALYDILSGTRMVRTDASCNK